MQLFATGLTLDGGNITYRPLKIGYTSDSSSVRPAQSPASSNYIDSLLQRVNSYVGLSKRSTGEGARVEDDVNLIAMLYVKFYTDHLGGDDTADSALVLARLAELHRALAAAGPVQGLVSRVLRDKLVKIVGFTQKQR